MSYNNTQKNNTNTNTNNNNNNDGWKSLKEEDEELERNKKNNPFSKQRWEERLVLTKLKVM
jgi:hypothetical protein